ncbi:ATP-binding protein [Roseivirga sp. BDSF3-8]|uniref:HD domain-containing protein n=1 Tax=Roseivirga sp. BDSF3-8 TaxID=3241598 RepID=UPI003531986C
MGEYARIKEELAGRIDDHENEEINIPKILSGLVDDLEQRARNHLKRITNVLPEFDIHDERHSEKVIANIADLLTDNNIKKLSAYELFHLHMSAFFHDCAMAPSDWEIETMKLTEGTEDYRVHENSIANDLKEAFKRSQAVKFIKDNKEKIYGAFDGDVKKWMFSPATEKDLIEYLSGMLIEYQEFRNGFAEELRRVENEKAFDSLNNYIRTDYIRATHHLRIEAYVHNLEDKFAEAFPQETWGKQLAKHLAVVCRSHGEDIAYVQDLKQAVQYYGTEQTNLQLMGMLLRLGDIIHFSFDRAPVELRASRKFKSGYSQLQWAIKDNGVNYSIENGTVTFRAYCEEPKLYFNLHQYLDWVELEIQNYYKLERQWSNKYKASIPNLEEKVDRSNINHDENEFLPKRGLSFTLNQKRIIELLMGVGLYKDKFACLRELYQNSLDACRCMIAEAKTLELEAKGTIEFGLEHTDDGTYLYCLDNGIGMTKDIIENYLLRIGNSYYKSPDFYKKQANWDGAFTPTSQFGIGILSCFMIGDRIEITTKTRTGEHISCVIDGPHENFYYRKAREEDKELLKSSGTIIKIRIDTNSIDIHDEQLEHPVLINLFPPGYHVFSDEEVGIFSGIENNIHHIVQSFIKIISPNLIVQTKTKNGNQIKINSNPGLPTKDELAFIQENNIDISVFLERVQGINNLTLTNNPNIGYTAYTRKINHGSVDFHMCIGLPLPGTDAREVLNFQKLFYRNYKLCVDGVDIDTGEYVGHTDYYEFLTSMGVINFIGENKPPISVDRATITKLPDEFHDIFKEISNEVIKIIIDISLDHIRNNEFTVDEEHNLWKIVAEKLLFDRMNMVSHLATSGFGDYYWPALTNELGENLTVKEIVARDDLHIKNHANKPYDFITGSIILYKALKSQRIVIRDYNSLSLYSSNNELPDLPVEAFKYDFYYSMFIACELDKPYSEFDIISKLYGYVSLSLFDYVRADHKEGVVKLSERHIDSTFLYELNASSIHPDYNINRNYGSPEFYTFSRTPNTINLSRILSKTNIMVLVFVPATEIDNPHLTQLNHIKINDPVYYEGIMTGWSILITGMKKDNHVFLPGLRTRAELVAELSDEFWEAYANETFTFTDGTPMVKGMGANPE